MKLYFGFTFRDAPDVVSYHSYANWHSHVGPTSILHYMGALEESQERDRSVQVDPFLHYVYEETRGPTN